MDSPEPTDPLARTLAAWQVSPPRHPQFRTHVWQRISRGPAGLPWGIYVRQHTGAFIGALALAIALGALGGHERARARAEAASARLATAYVQGLDARVLTTP